MEVSKTKVRSSWQESLTRIDLLKMKNRKDCGEFAKKKHASIIGIHQDPMLGLGLAFTQKVKDVNLFTFLDDSDYRDVSEMFQRCG